MTNPTVASARLCVLASALLWSLSGLVLKAPIFDSLPAESRGPTIAALRALVAALVLVPFVWSRPKRLRWALVPMSLNFAALSVLFVSAMMATTSAAAIFLQYTSVLWSCLLGWLILRERPGRPDVVALLFVAVGFWVILAPGGGSTVGNLLAVGSGVAYAGVIVSLRALRDEDPIWLSFVNQAVSALVLLPWLYMNPVSVTATQFTWIAFLGGIQLALPYVLFSIGVKHVSAREASLLTLIEPVVNPLWVLLAWGENVPGTTWAGGALILTGLFARFALVGRASPLPKAVPTAAVEPTAASFLAPPPPPEDPSHSYSSGQS